MDMLKYPALALSRIFRKIDFYSHPLEAYYVPTIDMDDVLVAETWIRDCVKTHDVEVSCSLTMRQIVLGFVGHSDSYKSQRQFIDRLFIPDPQGTNLKGPSRAGLTLWKALSDNLGVMSSPRDPKTSPIWALKFFRGKSQQTLSPIEEYNLRKDEMSCVLPLVRIGSKKPKAQKPFVPCSYPATCGSKFCAEFLKQNPTWPILVREKASAKRVLPQTSTSESVDFARPATDNEKDLLLQVGLEEKDFTAPPLRRAWPLIDIKEALSLSNERHRRLSQEK
ncbi:MAG: hypothetical protein MMC33_010494 [Icmadophila ericetorum]|nr:hypothetical protein [Icmadophila ericetorum]